MVITVDNGDGNISTGKTPLDLFLTGGNIYVIRNRQSMAYKVPNLFSTISELEKCLTTDHRLQKTTDKDIALRTVISAYTVDFKRSEQLIKEGANVNCIGSDGGTLLHSASNPEIADFLIKHGADVDAYTTTGACNDLYTPLHLAIFCSPWQDDIMTTLLFHNADPSIPDHNGDTPLMYLMKHYNRNLCSTEKLALLLNYEYDFSYVNDTGSSLLTLALISEYHRCYVDDIIARGGNFSTLSGDLQVLMWCIDHLDSEEFKWFWNVFNYKSTWFFKQPILYYLLKNLNYEAFDFVIQSSKLQDVLDVWFGNHDYKEGTILHSLECREEVFTLIDILNAIDFGYDLERAETAIYILLSFGYEPREHEVLEIYNVYGYGELFELCLNFEVLEPSRIYSSSSLIPKILLNPNRSGQEIVKQCLIHKNDVRRESLMFTFTMSQFYHYGTDRFLRNLYNNYQEIVGSSRRVPSLLELSRNQVLHGIWKQCKVKQRSYFWSVMKEMCLPPMIRDLILFKFPAYALKQ